MQLNKVLLTTDFEDIIGQDDTKRQLKTALLTGRHVIIVGQPGMGKTTLAKNVAKILPPEELNDCLFHCTPEHPVCPSCMKKPPKTKTVQGNERFIRIQGSPDLTAEDLIGDIDPIKALKFGPLHPDSFTPGKLFQANNGVLFFDEINRCSEKLQNALLQALEEKKVTIGSYTFDFSIDFIFIGTMNPEDASTEPLSDVFLDRFDLITMGYPETLDNELLIIEKHAKKLTDFPENLLTLIISYIRNLRNDPNIEKKPSVRASLGIYERAQAHALVQGRTKVTIDDIHAILQSVLAHRIRLKPSVKFIIPPDQYIAEEFKKFQDRGDYL
jgi:Mg-chelatase subunit ChlI